MKDRFFRFCRFFVRRHLKFYSIADCSCSAAAAPVPVPESISAPAAGEKDTGPVVFVVHHQNLRGPITSMAWFDRPVRPWVLSAFCTRKTCFRQFCDYTFTQRFHYPYFWAAIITFPISLLLPALMRSMNAIPVYRDPRETIKTFRQSLAALQNGESLLISPDVDYASSSEEIGELYEGFLGLEKYYQRESGRHLPFIPLHIDVRQRRILVGQAILFQDGLPFKAAKNEASRQLRAEMQRLDQSCEP